MPQAKVAQSLCAEEEQQDTKPYSRALRKNLCLLAEFAKGLSQVSP